jgi:hypothetical protein
MFAGNDARQFSPLVDKIISRLDHLKEPGTWSDLASVKKEVKSTANFQNLTSVSS